MADILANVLGNLNVNIDFFELYGLKKYTKSDSKQDDTFSSFLPIEISTTKFGSSINSSSGYSDDVDEHDGSGMKVNLKLPWKNQDMRDSVNVNFSKQSITGTNIEHLARQMLGVTLSEFANRNVIGQWLTTEYRSDSLKKEISLDFILPVGLSKTKTYDINWIKKVMHGLNKLQGLIYPRGYMALSPPLLKVKLGNIYSGFKGYITSVELTYSEDVITFDDGSVFPLIINGNIRFINLFTYGWYSDDSTSKLVDEFNLSGNGAVLFGIHEPDSYSNVAVTKNKPTADISSSIAESDSKKASGIKSVDPSSLFNDVNGMRATELNYDSFKNSIELANRNNGILTGFSNDTSILNNQLTEYIGSDYINDNMVFSDTDNLYKAYLKNYKSIANGELSFLNISDSSNLISSSNNVMNKVLNVQTISNYANLIKNIQAGDLIGSLASVTRITSGTSGVLNENLNNILSVTKLGTSILRVLNINGVTLNNISSLFGDIEELLKFINKIDTKSKNSKDEFTQAVYASTLQSQKITSVLNSVNENINYTNNRYEDNLSSSTLTSLANISNTAIATEIYDNYDSYKDVIYNLTLKATDLADNKIINTNILNSIDKMSSLVKKVDTELTSSTIDIFQSTLNKINKVI